MEKPPKYQPLFPKELDHLNQDFEKLKTRLDTIDYELENAPVDGGPQPRNRPSGPEGYDTAMRERRKKFLDGIRDTTVKYNRGNIEKQIGGLDDKTQQTILSRYDYETSKNGFKQYTKDTLKEVSDIEKEDKVSMDYMEAKHFSKYHETEKSFADEKENIDTWSEKYMTLLNNYKELNLEKVVDKEGIEPDLEL